MQIPDAVRTLERELRGIFGARLQSLVIYGARAAAPGPTRTMLVVDSLTEHDLRACASRVRGWHDAGLATPLVVAAHEFDRALDVFALEFGTILADHVLVAGASPFEGLTVDAADIRRACEVQARSHLLHLREGYLEAAGNDDAVAVLLVDSAAPLGALLASVARLEGRTDADVAAAGRHVERALGLPGGSLTAIVGLSGAREISAVEADRLFPAYLDAVERLVKYVDGWSAA
jgi:hypothetical protein